MKKFIILFLALISALCLISGCSSEIITQDMINERAIEYWHRSPIDGTEETLIEKITINEGDTFSCIEPPSYEGYEFDGWYTNYPSPHSWDKLEEGFELPKKGGLKVHSNYTPIEYNVTFFVNGIEYCSEIMSGQVNITEWLNFFGHIFDREQIASKISNENGSHVFYSDYFFLNGAYFDSEHTQPIAQNTRISKETNVYLKYDYSPVRMNYLENGAFIDYVNETELEFLNGVLTIPKTTQYGDPVIAINGYAFRNNSIIKEVIIQEGLIKIEENAFENSSIEKIVIPSTITYLGNGAFKNCNSLTSVEINTATSFNVNKVFEGCENLVYEEYKNAYYLGKYFMGVKSLDVKEIEIRPICEEIPENAFKNSAIVSVIIPESVVSIGNGAFANCEDLETVIIKGDINIDVSNVFTGCNKLKGEEYKNAYYLGKNLIGVKDGATNIEIKDNCVEIPSGIFSNSSVESVSIPSSVKKIGENAFKNSKLSSIIIPSTVEQIGNGAFSDCESLQSVEINTNANFEFNNVFENCNAIICEEYGNCYYVGNRFVRPINKDITWAEIKNGCDYIPKDAFKDCTKLNRVYIPKTVKRIGKHAFYNVNTHYFACYFEEKSSSIIFDVGANESILSSTQELTNYYFNTMPSGIKLASNGLAYGYRDMIEYTGEDAYGIVVFGYFGKSEEVVIESKYNYNGNDYQVKLIYQHVFMDNETVKKVNVKSCSVVGASAFLNAKSLEEVVLPSGCTQIGVKAFSGCVNLKKVSMGSGMLMICKLAFENCTLLEEVKCATSLKAWSDDATLIATFEANQNIKDVVLNKNADCWFFDAKYSKDVVSATLKSLGL